MGNELNNGSDGARRELFLERKHLVRISCYKQEKFAVDRGANLMQKIEARNLQKCPHGFEKIMPECQHCIWFRKEDVVIGQRPVQTDRPIPASDIPAIASAYLEEEEKQKQPE